MLLLLCMYRYQAIEAGWDVDSVLKVCLSRHSVSLSTQCVSLDTAPALHCLILPHLLS